MTSPVVASEPVKSQCLLVNVEYRCVFAVVSHICEIGARLLSVDFCRNQYDLYQVVVLIIFILRYGRY